MRCSSAWLGLALALPLLPSCSPAPATSTDAGGGGVDAPPQDAGARSCFVDADCDDGIYCNGEEACTNGHCTRTPIVCDDHVDCTRDLCLENNHACVSHAPDVDGDSFGDARCVDSVGVALGTDCDDTDPTVFPGNPEICDAIDQDCDPTTLGGGDQDHDGAVPTTCCNPQPDGTTACGRDCDDTSPSISQLATEICDMRDNDCDAHVDENVQMMSWPDVDHDGYGDASATPDTVCTVPSSRANQGGDCNDASATTHPMAAELCNGFDDDCDGTIDEGATAACAVPNSTAECLAGRCWVTGCATSYFDCNGTASDGCEVALCSNAMHCGACGGPTCGDVCTNGFCPGTVDMIYDIQGYVWDQVTGQAVVGATVTTIDECPIASATTDAMGHYLLEVPQHAQPHFIRITATGYPPHVEPAGSSVRMFPQSVVDAWSTDPDRHADAGPTRAIFVYEGSEVPTVIQDGHLGPSNSATGSDLGAFSGFGDRTVFMGALPQRMHVGGRISMGNGCHWNCTPEYDLLLEAGAVTHVDGYFDCPASCP